jgi:hypothetical protein
MVVEHLAVVTEDDLGECQRPARISGQQDAVGEGRDGAEVDGLREVGHGGRGYGYLI